MGDGTEIGKVRGLGPAHEGAGHWMQQRYTAVGNLLLLAFLAFSLLMLPDHGYETLSKWLSGTVPALAIALLLVSAFWHARLGLTELINDYVHDAGNKFAALLLLNFAAVGGTAFGIFALLRLVLGKGAA